MTTLLTSLIILCGAVALLNFIIFSTTRWWESWSGRALWTLWLTLIALAAHFYFEGGDPDKQADGREAIIVGALLLALLFNLGVVIYKKWFWRPEHDVKRDARRARRIAGRG